MNKLSKLLRSGFDLKATGDGYCLYGKHTYYSVMNTGDEALEILIFRAYRKEFGMDPDPCFGMQTKALEFVSADGQVNSPPGVSKDG